MAGPPRIVAHLDMDAFYASVELLRYPELRGRPVVIGGRSRFAPAEVADPATGATARRFHTLREYTGRGVVTTATYEARALGVNSAMGMMKAALKAPDAVLLPADFEQYRLYSRRFKAAVRALAPTVEDRGIDEIYVELTDLVAARLAESREAADADAASGPAASDAGEGDRGSAPGAAPETALEPDHEAEAWWCARELAQELKQAVRAATGLTCSIGLAPNKLIAKIASELDKPDGLAVVTARDVPLRLWPMPVRRINGIGPKAAGRLAALGIATIGELAAAPRETLVQQFGAGTAGWLHAAAHGHDARPVVTASEPKSISRETTFERDLHAVRDRAALSRILTQLALRVAEDLRRKGYAGRTIGVKLRFEDFRTVTRDQSMETATQDAATIRRAAALCAKRIDLTRRIRLLGVRVGTLERADAVS